LKSFKLPICLHTWTVKVKKHVLVEGDTCNGSCDYGAKVISIAKADSLDVQVTTFWHEFFHALYHEMGADLLSADEAFVETTAQNVARAIRALPEGFR
jgi:hypothetical protein